MSRPFTPSASTAPAMGSACNGAWGDIHALRTPAIVNAEASTSTHGAALLADFKAAARGIPGSSNSNLIPAYHTPVTESCCYIVPLFPMRNARPAEARA